MSDVLIGIYQDLNGPSLSVKDLVATLSATLAQDVPAGLEVRLANATFATAGSEAGSNALFSVSIDGGVNLADLPVVGAAFSQSTLLRFDIQVVAAEAAWTADEVRRLNALIPTPCPQLPAPAAGIAAGCTAQCTLSIGDVSIPLSIPVDPAAFAAGTSRPAAASASPGITWYPVQKTLGPLTVQQTGVAFDAESAAVTLYLDAAITLASLQVSLDALSISTPLQHLDPSLSLAGLGFSFATPGLTLSAALLNAGGGVFAGSASLETPTISIAAIGAYAPDDEGHPSLVVYAYAGGFAAGPPCLTVEGLAAGFGYNRRLVSPTLQQVASYPLVAAATGQSDPLADAATAMQAPQQGGALATALSAVSTYFPPSEGENFAAFGAKVSSFGMVDAFLLLEGAFGHDFTLDLIGLATATLPTPEDGNSASPLALVQVALLASWQPAAGTFLLQAQLTSASYVLSPSCHLTGGLALAVWYGDDPNAGDFVFTLGGYNRAFSPPDAYPRPQPLQLHWQISPSLSVEGQVYFALCPHCLMAGASAQAIWTDGGLSATFDIGFDVVIGWKPFFYTADFQVGLDVTYRFRIFGISVSLSLEMGATLEVWGPDFSGKAKIDVHGIGFTLDFGGASGSRPQPLSWSQFQSSFLPAATAYWTHAVVGGSTPSTAPAAPGDLGVVNASHLAFQISSAIPLTRLRDVTGAEVGIAPMAQPVGTVAAVGTLTVIDQETGEDVTASFAVNPTLAPLPAAMWGGDELPAINGPLHIPDGITGCLLVPAKEPSPGTTAVVSIDVLQSDPVDQPSAFEWRSVGIPAVVTEDEPARRADIASTVLEHRDAQRAVLASLGLSAMAVDCAPSVANIFFVAPQIVAAEGGRASRRGERPGPMRALG